MKTIDDVMEFHGHMCPGLALGYRVSLLAMREFGQRAEDEELVAIVENDSCAVDAVQVLTGCTFGKGNLFYRDYGKQVYTFIKRPGGEALRVAVRWNPPADEPEEEELWRRYSDGDRSEEVMSMVRRRKTRKISSILDAGDDELFDIKRMKMEPPCEAHIYRSIECSSCGEKVMEPRARLREGSVFCLPCFMREEGEVCK